MANVRNYIRFELRAVQWRGMRWKKGRRNAECGLHASGAEVTLEQGLALYSRGRAGG
jgi:hypothetical protein